MSEERAEYHIGPKLTPYITQMKFSDDTREKIQVRFGLYRKDKYNPKKTSQWWSGKVSVKRLFDGLQKAGLITREGDAQ